MLVWVVWSLGGNTYDGGVWSLGGNTYDLGVWSLGSNTCVLWGEEWWWYGL